MRGYDEPSCLFPLLLAALVLLVPLALALQWLNLADDEECVVPESVDEDDVERP